MKTIYKRILIANFIALLMALAFGASAQGFSKPTKTKSSVSTITDIVVEGKTFQGGTTKSGQEYVLRVSKKSGKTYKMYLGTKTGKTFTEEGKTYQVYVKNHKDGSKSYFYYTVTGEYPSSHKLSKD